MRDVCHEFHANPDNDNQTTLGMTHGIAQDVCEAFRWHHEAAEHWHPLSLLYLARKYATGQGTPVDKAEAFFWLEVAVRQELEASVPLLDQLLPQMTRAEIDEGERRIATRLPKLIPRPPVVPLNMYSSRKRWR